jgi:hypothetical protein
MEVGAKRVRAPFDFDIVTNPAGVSRSARQHLSTDRHSASRGRNRIEVTMTFPGSLRPAKASSLSTFAAILLAFAPAVAGAGIRAPAMITPTDTGTTAAGSPSTSATEVSAVLPGGRSVQLGTTATVFATMLNTGTSSVSGCTIGLPSSAPVGLSMAYQTTNPTTNEPTGTPNTPVTIAASGSQSFVLSFMSTAALSAPGLALVFDCSGQQPVASIPGVNTVDLLFSATPVADVIALAATATPGLTLSLPVSGAGAFAVATDNAGAAATLTVSADTDGAGLPLTLDICQTDPTTAACLAAPAPTVALDDTAGSTPTFSVFTTASAAIPFNPAASRIFVRFEDASGVSHGSTSVAVETDAPMISSFTASYQGAGAGSNDCNTTDSIVGEEPATGGPFPLFVYMVGTTETFTNASATLAVQSMADLGYVAATIQYNSATFGDCTQIQAKAECIFDATSSASAITALCAKPNVDCSLGILTAGFSQGAVMATQSQNYNADVKATWGMGDGVMYTAAFDLTSCQANGNRSLPSSALRAVNGQGDEFTGDTNALQQANMQSLTGFDCAAGSTSCLQTNGSGWIIVQNGQTESGDADHCYMRDGGCLASENSLDSGWMSGTENWELAANLSWLSGFAPSSN